MDSPTRMFFAVVGGLLFALSAPLVIIIQTVRYLRQEPWRWVSGGDLWGYMASEGGRVESIVIWFWNDLWLGFLGMILGILISIGANE